MGWQTDWLYQAIFNEYRRAWDKAQQEGRGQFGPASARLIVCEFSDADFERPTCRGDRIRVWTFAGIDFHFVPNAEFEELRSGEITGMFYTTAVAGFHITGDRKRVVLEYCFGPRYGRGF